MRRLCSLLIALCLLTALCGCGGQSAETPSATGELFAMDTYMTVTCYGDACEEALAASLAEIQRLDALLSTGEETSEISRLNAAGGGALSEDALTIVEEALSLWSSTGGAFDITIYPLMALWGFTDGDYAVPDAEALAETLALCGSDRLTLADGVLTLGDGQGIDLGGIAKGYTSDRLMEIFAEYGLVSGCVSLGGNVQCYGTKPDGSLWRVGIADPDDPEDSLLGVLSVSDRAVITSGGYERYFVDEATGETFHHILDPSTGCPADSDLVSVTVVSADGLLADGLSTACYVMGLEASADYWRSCGDDFDLILVADDGTVYLTAPLEGSFETERTVVCITR